MNLKSLTSRLSRWEGCSETRRPRPSRWLQAPTSSTPTQAFRASSRSPQGNNHYPLGVLIHPAPKSTSYPLLFF